MELLAPAGNMECLKTAVRCGADAVYFAGKQFGARSFAENFSEEEIHEAAAHCRLHGVKSYITINTMTTDRELSELDRFVAVLAEAGVDGVIVQDLGVLRRIRQICPQMPLHASTQMTVHNLAGVQELERLGATRVVLARELSASEIQEISAHCKAELEVFVHGALCMSYSGQCLMSSVLGGRSGNRGKCAQPCRLQYSLPGGEGKFYLSLKDFSLASHLERLDTLGVSSLKIEGRMKGPEYIAAVVSTYRRCLDEHRKPTKEETEWMNRVFFRGGLTDGYFTGKIGPTMFAFDKPDNPYAKAEGKAAQQDSYEKKGISATCTAEFGEGMLPRITVEAEGETATCYGDMPLERAEKNVADRESIIRQIEKTGGTSFVFTSVLVELSGNPFVPVKTINALRRAGLEALQEKILNSGRKEIVKVPLQLTRHQRKEKYLQFTASVYRKEQFDVVKEFPFAAIDVPLHLVAENPEAYLSEKERILLNPSVILQSDDFATSAQQLLRLREMGFCALRAENIGSISLGEGFQIWGGHRLNLANRLALQTVRDMGMQVAALSAELNLAQIRDLQGELPTEVLGYGHLPLMITENCVLKNMKACPCNGIGEMQDRKGKRFFIIKDGASCRNVILNAVPLYMGDKLQEMQASGVDFCRLLFTKETPQEVREICQSYQSGKDSNKEYTRLHYYKGVN